MRNTRRSPPPKISDMTTTTTIDTNEGWTFADDNNPTPEFPTTTEPNNYYPRRGNDRR